MPRPKTIEGGIIELRVKAEYGKRCEWMYKSGRCRKASRQGAYCRTHVALKARPKPATADRRTALYEPEPGSGAHDAMQNDELDDGTLQAVDGSPYYGDD